MGLFGRKITYERALKTAQSYYDQYKVVRAWDLGDSWLFGYDFDLSTTGISCILIGKKDGSVSFYRPPEYKGVMPSEKNLIFDNS